MSDTRAYPLRLPRSLKIAVEQLSKQDGTSINQFVATAVAEEISALKMAVILSQAKNLRSSGQLQGFFASLRMTGMFHGFRVSVSRRA